MSTKAKGTRTNDGSTGPTKALTIQTAKQTMKVNLLCFQTQDARNSSDVSVKLCLLFPCLKVAFDFYSGPRYACCVSELTESRQFFPMVDPLENRFAKTCLRFQVLVEVN